MESMDSLWREVLELEMSSYSAGSLTVYARLELRLLNDPECLIDPDLLSSSPELIPSQD
jgi:hypothetical protein